MPKYFSIVYKSLLGQPRGHSTIAHCWKSFTSENAMETKDLIYRHKQAITTHQKTFQFWFSLAICVVPICSMHGSLTWCTIDTGPVMSWSKKDQKRPSPPTFLNLTTQAGSEFLGVIWKSGIFAQEWCVVSRAAICIVAETHSSKRSDWSPWSIEALKSFTNIFLGLN